MKLQLLPAALLLCASLNAQFSDPPVPGPLHERISLTAAIPTVSGYDPGKKPIVFDRPKWRISKNHLLTGGLVFTAGLAKGFNETLQFHWYEFHRQFPKLNENWFNPMVSWKNKYKNGDATAGPKFPLSTSALVMFTDQYHLNNFINRAAWGGAVIFKLGEGRKPLKHYLLDLLYYTACHQAGFALSYYPFSKAKAK